MRAFLRRLAVALSLVAGFVWVASCGGGNTATELIQATPSTTTPEGTVAPAQ